MTITWFGCALALGLVTTCMSQGWTNFNRPTLLPFTPGWSDSWNSKTESSDSTQTWSWSSSTSGSTGTWKSTSGGTDETPTSTPMWESTTFMPKTTRRPDTPATYWITYSKTVRPGHPMVFRVHIFKGTSPVDIVIHIKNSKGDRVLLDHGPVSVMPNVPTKISVDIPLNMERANEDSEWDYWSQYNVEVMGRGSEVQIKEKGYAAYQQKSFSIFVQTDKGMYKPSQKVQFRTLAMTPDMKVMRDVKQDITVYDSKNNRILQYRGVQASDTLGVVDKTFTLASSVPTGTWKITVTIEGVEEVKEFTVSDYVLPRFEVEVDAPEFGVTTSLMYSFKVKATYTFGKPVTDGYVSVLINLPTQYYYGEDALRQREIIRLGTLDKNGEMKVDVLVDELRRIGQTRYNKEISEYWKYEITANVTENRTGKTHSGKHNFAFYSTPIKMDFLDITPTSFKSGLDFTSYIEVTKRDGSLFSPLELKDISLLVNVTYAVPAPKPTTPMPTTMPTTMTNPELDGVVGPMLEVAHEDFIPRRGFLPQREKSVWKQLVMDKNTYQIPETGWVVISFRVPDDALNLKMEAKTESVHFEGVTRYRHLSRSISPSDSFLQLNVINKKPRVGDTVRVQAKATDDMKLLNYQVFCKGILVFSSTVQGPSRSLEFQFVATKAMSPSMSIVAFYLKDTGEFVVDGLSLSVNGLFDNAVKVEFSKEKVKPGEDVNLVVTGEKDSLVFMLVVDKSVKLLKDGNDITQEMVLSELSSYDHGNYGNWRYMFICGWPSYFGGDDAQAVFDNAGVIVLTDGLVYSRYMDEDNEEKYGGYISPFPVNYRGSGFSNSGGNKMATRTRKLFPETWLWNIAVLSRSNGQVVLPLKSPDTITSWLASVFSVNPQTGLSVAEKPAEVITFRDMFISLDLPSFIIRGEEFCFNASVFSYYPAEIPILLTLDRSPDFKVIMPEENKENGTIHLVKEQLYFSNFMGFLKENEVRYTPFCFEPHKIGEITLHVSAMTDVPGLSDAVERKLMVKPEGVHHTTTISNLVTPVAGSWLQSIPIEFPDGTVNGSEKISVNVAGNLLGPIFDNLDDLLKKPYGCGEQNMINFSPIMSLVDFFYTTNTITEEFRQKAVDYMLIGYQKELLYEHGQTGGYSTFGNQDNPSEHASMWLTAFVTKCFSQAEILDMKYQNILAMDVKKIRRSALWMIKGKNQQRDGSFLEHGKVFNKGLQGGSSKGIALTSYTVISLYHALKVLAANPELNSREIEMGMRNGVQFLEDNLETMVDPYDICITTYALTLVGSPLSNSSFVMMDRIAKRGFGMTYWERPKEVNEPYYYWSRGSDAINIEATSYALLTYSLLGIGTTDGLPIIRWLSKQKGPNGGFISTQDTVIGIEALTSVAKGLYGAQFVPMTITINTKNANGDIQGFQNIQVTKDNEMLLQRHDIPYQRGNTVEVLAQTPAAQDTSKSTVLVDVVMNYNVDLETQDYSYGMTHRVETHPDKFYLSINIWTKDGTPDSMSLLEVDIPAGFDPDDEEIMKNNSRVISKLDRKEDRINVYINTGILNSRGTKIHLLMLHTGGTIVNPKPKIYKISDYYESKRELSKKYYLEDNGGDFCSKVPDVGICKYQ